jgi:hypothetical protein
LVSDGINGPSFNHHTYEDTLNVLLSENISVYGVAVGRNSFHSKFALMRNYATDSGEKSTTLLEVTNWRSYILGSLSRPGMSTFWHMFRQVTGQIPTTMLLESKRLTAACQ